MKRYNSSKNYATFVLGLLLSLLICDNAFAQTGTATVRGTVADPQGSAVAGASVTLTNDEKNFTRTQTTNEEGGYIFSAVSPGTYRLEAEGSGFKKAVATDVRALVNTPTDVNVKLEVGNISETIEISAATEAPINTTDATIGNTFTERQILQLPLEGRNVAGLLSLQPGVTFFGMTDQRGETTDYRNGSVNGGKSDQANVTLDGVDVNDQQNGFAFNSVLRVTLDSVQEFRVTTTNPNAEQGRSSGAQIGLVTKSGSNEWHGSLYEFHRNTVTSANTFFNNMAGVPTPKLLRNVFGGAVGGPIKKDRLFFFFNYEGRRDAREESVLRTVPSVDLRQGIFTYTRTAAAGGGIGKLTPEEVRALDPLGIGPSTVALAIFRQYPLPNASGGDGLNSSGFRFNAPVALRWNTYIARFDYNLTADGAHTFNWRGNLQNDRDTSSPQFPGQQSRFTNLTNSKGFALGYLAVLQPTLTNSLRYGFTRQGVESSGAAPAQGFVSFRNFSDLQALTRSSSRISPVHNLVEDLTWVKGNHSLQFGGNIRFITNGSINYGNSFPSGQTRATYLASITPLRPANSVASTGGNEMMSALLGLLTRGTAIYNYDRTGQSLPVGAPVVRDFAAREYETYAQDSWRVRPNLTLTLGLRYSLYSPFFEKNGNQVAPAIRLGDWFDLRAQNAAQGISSNRAPRISFDLAGPKNGRRGFYDWDTNNFAPRLAFAYSPGWKSGWIAQLTGGPSSTSIRGGYGIVYDRIGASLASSFDSANAFGLSNVLSTTQSTFSVATAPRLTSLSSIPQSLLPPDPGTTFPATPGSLFSSSSAIDDTITTPYSQQMDFSISRQLPKNLSLEIAYVGRAGTNLLVSSDLAMPLDLVDARSGVNYYTAVNRLLGFPTEAAVQPIPYWENLFPGLAAPGRTATQGAYRAFTARAPDYITALQDIDRDCRPSCSIFGPYAFFSDQYSNLNAFRSIMPSSYHAMQLIVRKRLSAGTQFDFNYTLGKSIDWASRAERNGERAGSVYNSWDPGQRSAPSDYDVRHNLNFNGIAELPFGRGQRFGSNVSGWQNAIIGGWQLSGIWRWTSGLPTWFINSGAWPTNWQFEGGATATGPVPGVGSTRLPSGPNLFSDPAAAYATYTYTRPGFTGQRNNIRGDGYFAIDTGLSKGWSMPYNENHNVQFRWEVFNVTNTAKFDAFGASGSLGNPVTWGRYNDQITQPRVMQFGLRYQF